MWLGLVLGALLLPAAAWAQALGGVPNAARGVPLGVATLDATGRLPAAQLPALTALPAVRLTGVPSQHTSVDTGQDTLAALLLATLDDATQPNVAQSQTVLSFAPGSGALFGVAPGAARATLQVGMAAQPGSGLVRGLLMSFGLAAGYGGMQAFSAEIDHGFDKHYGDAADWLGQRLFDGSGNPVQQAGGLSLDGLSTGRGAFALRVAGQTTDGGPLWNYGISVHQGSVRQVAFGDFSNADRSIAIFGTHTRGIDFSGAGYTGSAALLGPGQSVNARTSGGTEVGLISGRAADGVTVLSSGQGVLAQGLVTGSGGFAMAAGALAQRGLDLRGGAYLAAAIGLGPGHTINAADAGGTDHVLINGRPADGAVMLGNGQAVISSGAFTSASSVTVSACNGLPPVPVSGQVALCVDVTDGKLKARGSLGTTTILAAP